MRVFLLLAFCVSALLLLVGVEGASVRRNVPEAVLRAEATIDALNAARAAAKAASSKDAVLLPPVTGRNDVYDAKPSASSAEGDYELHKVSVPASGPSGPAGLNLTTFKYQTVQGLVTIYVGIAENPLQKFKIFPAPRPAAKGAQHGNTRHSQRMRRVSPMHSALASLRDPQCDGVSPTSASAVHYGCLLAMNGGFFDTSNGGCEGNVYSEGQLINTATPNLASHANFALTKNGNWVSGYLTPGQISRNDVDGGFTQLITGNGWLVREGKNYINQSMVNEGLPEAFVAEKAPRNAIGHDRQGRLLQFEADGEEDILLGLTLREYSSILSEHFDVVNAINLDGGGSSTTVYKGQVINHPTCHDTPVMCERAVTTISCLMP